MLQGFCSDGQILLPRVLFRVFSCPQTSHSSCCPPSEQPSWPSVNWSVFSSTREAQQQPVNPIKPPVSENRGSSGDFLRHGYANVVGVISRCWKNLIRAKLFICVCVCVWIPERYMTSDISFTCLWCEKNLLGLVCDVLLCEEELIWSSCLLLPRDQPVQVFKTNFISSLCFNGWSLRSHSGDHSHAGNLTVHNKPRWVMIFEMAET